MAIARPEEIILFWNLAGPKKWFNSDAAFDQEISSRFLETYEAGARGELSDWERSTYGALALVLLLDQFPRNIFRGTPKAFATDEKAKQIADRAIAAGRDQSIDKDVRPFFYMPFMHSEALGDQERCVALMQKDGKQENVKYAEIHRDAIARFGRFPHRNEILGRKSTPEEIAYLEGGGFKG